VEYLYARNNFTPVITNNQLYSQGYFGEISAFVDAVEGRRNDNLSSLQAVRDTYELIQQLSSC
jgi:virulence factor